METAPVENICKSCGNKFTGLYCNQCGEKVMGKHDRSFRTFLNSVLVALTLADSKFLKTLWFMVKSPGFISDEFSEGRRVKYLKPLSIFFLLNLIYFLVHGIQLFNASLRTQLNSLHGKLAMKSVAVKMTEMGLHDVGSFSLIYDQKTTGLAKMLVILYAVLVSLPLSVIYRSRNRYFTDHVGLSVELVCFNLALNALLLSLIVNLTGLGLYLDELILSSIFIATNLYFLIRSGYTFYHERGFRLILKSLFMIVMLKIMLDAYRAILFYITMMAL